LKGAKGLAGAARGIEIVRTLRQPFFRATSRVRRELRRRVVLQTLELRKLERVRRILSPTFARVSHAADRHSGFREHCSGAMTIANRERFSKSSSSIRAASRADRRLAHALQMEPDLELEIRRVSVAQLMNPAWKPRAIAPRKEIAISVKHSTACRCRGDPPLAEVCKFARQCHAIHARARQIVVSANLATPKSSSRGDTASHSHCRSAAHL